MLPQSCVWQSIAVEYYAKYVLQQPLDFMFSSRQRLPAQHETRCLQEARGGGRLKTIYCCTSEQDGRQHAREGEGVGAATFVI